jgi:hypothetical protein
MTDARIFARWRRNDLEARIIPDPNLDSYSEIRAGGFPATVRCNSPE